MFVLWFVVCCCVSLCVSCYVIVCLFFEDLDGEPICAPTLSVRCRGGTGVFSYLSHFMFGLYRASRSGETQKHAAARGARRYS